jgi:DNA polymerase-3 subunit delta
MIPVYLYIGPEFGQRNDAIEQHKLEVEKKFGEIDYHLVYAQDVSLGEVLSLLQGGSLFANARFVVLKNAELIKNKEDIELLRNWIDGVKSQNYDDSFLFLVSDETSIDKKLENLVPKENKQIFWEMFEDRKEQWLSAYFAKNGYKIQEEAISAILEMIENNTEALRNECSRFFLCFEKNHLITEEDVDQILAHNREESPFTLFNSIADYTKPSTVRLEQALSILQKIRNSKESNGIQFIAGLTWCFRKLKLWLEINPTGSLNDFELKKNGFSSKKMQTQYKNASRIWDIKQTNKILSQLAQTDIQIRQTGSISEDNLLELMIYSIIIKKGEGIEKMNIENL